MKKNLISIIILLFYSLIIDLMPIFDFYVIFRGFVFPLVISIVLTIINFNTTKNLINHIIKLFFYILLGYLFRLIIFYVLNGYFDINIKNLKTDWYCLYLLMQIPTILFSTVLTGCFLGLFNRIKLKEHPTTYSVVVEVWKGGI